MKTSSYKIENFDAIIYDMDGLIVDSEPLWQQAEIEVFRLVDINLTKELCETTKGLRIDEVIKHWFQISPWSKMTQKSLEQKVVDRLIELIKSDSKLLPGVKESLSFFKEKKLKIGLASASYYKIIDSVLKTHNLNTQFDLVYSAEDERYGKPHPGIFISAAQKLNTDIARCLILEDSLNGVLAAKSARAKCIAVPATNEFDNPKFAIADKKLKSLSELINYFN